jgi:hypothetical protein
MGDIASGLLAILSGGATGLLGVIAQRLFDHWKLKQELDQLRERNRHEVEMRREDAKIMELEWTGRVKVAEKEGEALVAKADAEAFAASFQLEPKRYSEGVKVGKWGAFLLVLADVLRAVVRPGLTVYLAWIATELYGQSQALMAVLDLQSDVGRVAKLHEQIVLTLLYLFVTCVTWWFGTRNKQPQPKLA